MCGIWGYIGYRAHEMFGDVSKKCVGALRARGPEMERTVLSEDGNCVLGFTRLAINGLNEAGMQPFTWVAPDGMKYRWICNGEIYNWRALASRFRIESQLVSGSDCEVLGPIFNALGENIVEFCHLLDGVFSFLIVNETSGTYYIGRDPYGVRPLYISTSTDRRGKVRELCFGSELASVLPAMTNQIRPVTPGSALVYNQADGMLTELKYHETAVAKADWSAEEAMVAVREALEAAVRKRMMTERPVAALLSGGLDSSLIAALVARELRVAGVETPLETYSIGFEGSEDLRHAQMVAEWIGSKHSEIIMTADEFFAAIPEVVRVIQSYDITSVRASVGNYLVARAVRERSAAKVLFNGDGSDEVLGGYMYFYRAPSDEAFEGEIERILGEIHAFDVLRSDRSISANGLEGRVPFLDKEFVRVARQVPTSLRRPGSLVNGEPICEKWILRKAFEESELLPPQVLWRRKEAFSNGVSSGTKDWAEEIRERVTEVVSPNWSNIMYSHLRPTTAEAFWYRVLFEKNVMLDPNSNADAVLRAATPHYWLPRWINSGGDPSAKVLKDIVEFAEKLAESRSKN